MFIEKLEEKEKCWWCGSRDLTREHKFKRTELELLYGKSYPKSNRVGLIKHRTEDEVIFVQGSKSDEVKFSSVLCKTCNNSKSQKFDKAYHKLIQYYFNNKEDIILSGKIAFEKVFGKDWQEEKSNIYRYIAKHIGCRMAELGFKPSLNFIDFLNGTDYSSDIKIIFQIKPYLFGNISNPIDFIFLGPFNPINNSSIKKEGIITSFSGWYTFANLSWNYIYEQNVNLNKNEVFNSEITLDIVSYKESEALKIDYRYHTFEQDFGNGLEKVEYYPFWGPTKEVDHYLYIKSY